MSGALANLVVEADNISDTQDRLSMVDGETTRFDLLP